MTEEYKNYSTHVYDLSYIRKDTPINLERNSINVIAITHDCYIKINEKWEDPINLMHAGNIKGNFNKLYLSNNANVGGYVAIIIGSCDFELSTNIARPQYKPLELPQQNIPQHLQDWAIDRPQLVNIWDIQNAVLRHSFYIGDQDTGPSGLFFKPDGLKLYMIGRSHGNVYEYNLTRAWDISTAVFEHSFNISPQSPHGQNLFFSPDGAFMYVIDFTINSVFQYDLSIAWNVTTATHIHTFATTAQTTTPTSIIFNPTGYKMYITAVDGDRLIEYNLTRAWDISTTVFIHSFDMSHIITSPLYIFFSPDGLKCYVIGITPDKVIAYRLLEAWNITTAIYRQSFDYSLITQTPQGLFFKPDGSKMYMICGFAKNILEFDL